MQSGHGFHATGHEGQRDSSNSGMVGGDKNTYDALMKVLMIQ